jgi:branched-chain amino acid transport system permease protein
MADILRRRWRRPAVIALLIVVGLLPPLGIRADLLNALILSFYYVVLASSWNMLAGYTGQFSLAQQTFAAIGGYTTGLAIHYFDVPIWEGIVLAVLVSALVGMLLGMLFLRLRAIYFAIATWAFAGSIQIVLTAAYKITRGQQGLSVPPLLGNTLDPRYYYYVFFAMMLVCLAAIALVIRSRIGRFLLAIKGDELRAATLGVNTTVWKVFAFSFTSMLSGLAGAFYAHYIVVLSPAMADFTVVANVVVMVIVGGMATLEGPVLGGIVIGVLAIYLQKYGAWNNIVFAVIVLVIMRLWRRGAVQLISEGCRRLTRRRQPAVETSAGIPGAGLDQAPGDDEMVR